MLERVTVVNGLGFRVWVLGDFQLFRCFRSFRVLSVQGFSGQGLRVLQVDGLGLYEFTA